MFYTSVSSGSSNTAGPVELQPLGSGWHKCSITFGTTLFKRLHKVLAPWSYKKLEQKVSLHQLSFFTHIISSVSQGLWSLLCLGTLLMTVSFISFCSPSSLPPSLEQNPLGFKQPTAPTFPTRKPHTAFIAGCWLPIGDRVDLNAFKHNKLGRQDFARPRSCLSVHHDAAAYLSHDCKRTRNHPAMRIWGQIIDSCL